MGGPTIAIIGGGVYVPRLCTLLSQALPPDGTLRLFARRPERLARIANYTRARLGRGWRVTAARTLAECADGADAVVLLVRVGGLEARAHDERFAEAFGLAGDEGLGPGGFANAYRTLPVLVELAATLRAHCPRALVCNLVAPLGLTTRALVAEGLDAVGVCELPAVTLELLAGGGGATFDYAGLNHLGWFWNLERAGEPLLPSAVARGLVDGEVLARFGAAPLRYYYEVFDRAAGARLGIARRPGRAQALMDLAERALASFAATASDAPTADAPKTDAPRTDAPRTDAPMAQAAPLDERPTPWFDRALVPLVAARFGAAPYVGFLNVANQLRIPSLPPATIVELPARVHGDSCVVTPAPDCPPRVTAFLRAVADAEELAYQAARAADPALLARAMEALPLGITRAQSLALTDAALADAALADAAPTARRTQEATP